MIAYSTRRTRIITAIILMALPAFCVCGFLFHWIPDGPLGVVISVACLAAFVVGLLFLRHELTSLITLQSTAQQILELSGNAEKLHGSENLLESFQRMMDQEYAWRVISKEAELYALQSQINPHFLYNTLECIRGEAVLEGSDIIADMAQALSNYFRYNINRSEKMVSLKEELDHLRDFLVIQNYRFDNRYQLSLQFDSSDRTILENMLLPRFTLQPIVENALQHGLRNTERETETIDIDLRLTEKRFLIRITDHGVGMDTQTLRLVNEKLRDNQGSETFSHEKGNGVALSNIAERIRLAFGADYGLHVSSTLGVGTVVEVILPRK